MAAAARRTNVRLRDRRRRLGRLRPRQPADGRREALGPAARGRPARPQSVAPRSDRLRQDHVPPVLNWGFYTEPEPHRTSRKIYTPRGPHARRLERDQRPDPDPQSRRTSTAGRRSGRRAGTREALRYFIKSERTPRRERAPRRRRTARGVRHRRAARAGRGADRRVRRARHPRTDDFNGARQEGAGYLQLTTRNGLRCSAATASQARAAEQPDGRDRRSRERHRVRRAARPGVAIAATARRRRARGARGALCAGAVQSPQLLQLSGVGPAALLQGTASRWSRTCRASARTCRTTCCCASSTSARSRSRPTTICAASGARPGRPEGGSSSAPGPCRSGS